MNKCETCRANKVCDHNRFGFETCGNYIPTNEWISVEDRLPEAGQEILGYFARFEYVKTTSIVASTDGTIMFEWWNGKYKLEGSELTHWMPLPEPPKGEPR